MGFIRTALLDEFDTPGGPITTTCISVLRSELVEFSFDQFNFVSHELALVDVTVVIRSPALKIPLLSDLI